MDDNDEQSGMTSLREDQRGGVALPVGRSLAAKRARSSLDQKRKANMMRQVVVGVADRLVRSHAAGT